MVKVTLLQLSFERTRNFDRCHNGTKWGDGKGSGGGRCRGNLIMIIIMRSPDFPSQTTQVHHTHHRHKHPTRATSLYSTATHTTPLYTKPTHFSTFHPRAHSVTTESERQSLWINPRGPGLIQPPRINPALPHPLPCPALPMPVLPCRALPCYCPAPAMPCYCLAPVPRSSNPGSGKSGIVLPWCIR